jgi:hypothetical protein
MRLDHVICGTRDLDRTAAVLEQEHGIRFLPGGRHPGGTVNRVAPLAPPQYLELISVESVLDAETRKLDALIEEGRAFLGWAIAVDDIQAVADRMGRPVQAGSIAAADGSTASWRFAYDPDDDSLPFFISYDADSDARMRRWRERVDAAGMTGFGGFTFVEVAADREHIRRLVGDADLPIRHASGPPGIHAVGIGGPAGEIVLRDSRSG